MTSAIGLVLCVVRSSADLLDSDALQWLVTGITDTDVAAVALQAFGALQGLVLEPSPRPGPGFRASVLQIPQWWEPPPTRFRVHWHDHDLTSDIVNVSQYANMCGGSCDVYRGLWYTRNVTVAIKRLRPITGRQAKFNTRLWREILVWQQLHHQNILPLCGVYHFSAGSPPSLVSPWCVNGDITTYLRARNREFDFNLLQLRTMVDVLRGLEYLHTHEPVVVHGDLKAANILVSDAGVAQLWDFGLSAILMEDFGTGLARSSSVHGTSRWMSPELTDDLATTTTASDIWACGCVMYEIFTGQLPYRHLKRDCAVIIAVSRGELPSNSYEGIPDDVRDLMLRCWTRDAGQRPCVGTVLEMVLNFSENAEQRFVRRYVTVESS